VPLLASDHSLLVDGVKTGWLQEGGSTGGCCSGLILSLFSPMGVAV
jgi:hypothetical protein